MEKVKISKEEFFNLDQEAIQDITRDFIEPHIHRNQSALICHLQEQNVEDFYFEDIKNLYYTDEQLKSYYSEDVKSMSDEELDEFRYDIGEREIYEWYLVSDWFLSKLRQINEPYIDNDYGEYWGRTCFGQSIYLDYNIQELAYKYSYDERLFKRQEVA